MRKQVPGYNGMPLLLCVLDIFSISPPGCTATSPTMLRQDQPLPCRLEAALQWARQPNYPTPPTRQPSSPRLLPCRHSRSSPPLRIAHGSMAPSRLHRCTRGSGGSRPIRQSPSWRRHHSRRVSTLPCHALRGTPRRSSSTTSSRRTSSRRVLGNLPLRQPPLVGVLLLKFRPPSQGEAG